MTTPILEMTGVSAAYGSVPALTDVSLEVMDNDVRVLLGANGAGKSTVLKAILGLVRVTDGTITFRGTQLRGMSPSAIHRLGIAWSPQGRQTFTTLTVENNLSLGWYLAPSGRALRERQEEMYTLFPILAERRRQLAGSLSGGEQQTLSIARALMSKPRLLVMDEPSIGLSPKIMNEVFGLVETIRANGASVLIVEQNARQALAVAAWAYVLETGRIVGSDTPERLLRNDMIRSAYLGS